MDYSIDVFVVFVCVWSENEANISANANYGRTADKLMRKVATCRRGSGCQICSVWRIHGKKWMLLLLMPPNVNCGENTLEHAANAKNVINASCFE